MAPVGAPLVRTAPAGVTLDVTEASNCTPAGEGIEDMEMAIPEEKSWSGY